MNNQKQKQMQLIISLISLVFLILAVYIMIDLGAEGAIEKKLKLNIIKEDVNFDLRDSYTGYSESIDPKFNVYIENNYDPSFSFDIEGEDIDPKFSISH